MSKYLELVEGSFTQEHLNKQKNQKPYVAYSIKDGKVIYTIIPNEEEEKYTIYRAINYVDISNCTYNTVDLGLPSGLKWADRNIGSKSPEHFGSYFQWGDTNPYTYVGELTTQELVDLLNGLSGGGVTVDNVKDILASEGVTGNDLTEVVGYVPALNREFNWDNYFDTTDGGNTFNKYNNNGGLTVLEPTDDAATVHTNSQLRMPTIDEIRELINNTVQTAIDIQGNEYSIEEAENGIIKSRELKGVRLTGPNGSSIFLPAAGVCLNADYIFKYFYGVYFSSEFGWLEFINDPGEAMYHRFSITIIDETQTADNSRYIGCSIRGVENEEYDYVDMHLPSGTKWATKNIGASTLFDDGLYFSRGNLNGYTASQMNSGEYNEDYATTKGSKLADQNIPANSEYDAAFASTNGRFRLPTENEFKELIQYTTVEFFAKTNDGNELHFDISSGESLGDLEFNENTENIVNQILSSNARCYFKFTRIPDENTTGGAYIIIPCSLVDISSFSMVNGTNLVAFLATSDMVTSLNRSTYPCLLASSLGGGVEINYINRSAGDFDPRTQPIRGVLVEK